MRNPLLQVDITPTDHSVSRQLRTLLHPFRHYGSSPMGKEAVAALRRARRYAIALCAACLGGGLFVMR
jgi:hypothetical protein